MAILSLLKSGDLKSLKSYFKKSHKWRFLGVLKVATLRRLKSGDYKKS